jgi:hypothetical protein
MCLNINRLARPREIRRPRFGVVFRDSKKNAQNLGNLEKRQPCSIPEFAEYGEHEPPDAPFFGLAVQPEGWKTTTVRIEICTYHRCKLRQRVKAYAAMTSKSSHDVRTSRSIRQ